MPGTRFGGDDEFIHISNAIQPHGALVVCDLVSFKVNQISANAIELFGVEPEDILEQPVDLLFHSSNREAVIELVASASLEEHCLQRINNQQGVPLECLVHRVANTAVIEVEMVQGVDAGAFDHRARRALMSLTRARGPIVAAERVVREVRELTGFDRVIFYRFDAEWNGRIVAESRRPDLEAFLGLQYRASDTLEARRLCTVNRLRVIADVSDGVVPLVPANHNGVPLDLSRAQLRSASPAQIEFLSNMGVTAVTSVPVVSEGRLIGLIACHHYSGPRVPSHAVRETLEYVGQHLAWKLELLEQAEGVERARFVQQCELALTDALSGTDDLIGSLTNNALCSLTQGAGAAVVLAEGTRTVGTVPELRAIGEIVLWLQSRSDDVFATDRLADHLPGAEAWGDKATGLLAATIAREPGEYLLWFRPSAERTIDWVGEPRSKVVSAENGTHSSLSRRGSIALWRETIRGRSSPWLQWQLNAASHVRRLLLGPARRRVAVLKSLNQRLADADRAKDLFIATISHELRNPLAAIAGWSRLYLDGALPVERRDDVVKIVSRNAGVLSNLVDDLLDISRMLTGSVSLEIENVEMPALIESVVNSMAVATDAKGLRVKTTLGTSTAPILGDAARLRQIVSNLLSNAIKFTPNGGSISIAFTSSESDIELLVADTGVGLAPGSAEHIFETFWQVDSSTVRKEKGLGLGLSIVKSFVELHGGKVSVESAGLGHGTTFRVILPVASTRFSESQPPPKPGSHETCTRSLAGVRVLLVEDDDDGRTLVRKILEQSGALVFDVASAPIALEALATQSFDVVVSDVGMPYMDGFELIAAVRNHEMTSVAKIPAVALTAYSRAVDRTKALRAGFQAHVRKPTEPDELIAVVSSVLR